GQVLEIGGPAMLTMNQILRTMLEVMQLRRPLLHAPVVFPRLAAAAMEKVLPSPPLTPGAIDFVLPAGGDVDMTALLEILPAPRRPLREGLSTYLAPRSNEPEVRSISRG